jgi:CheY-like chemotaxis protein
MKALVVEDNPVNRRLVCDVLKLRGHCSDPAETAAAAIAALDGGEPPDVILLDIDVPGGGLTVLSHVKSTPRLERIPVIALTAFAMQGDRDRFLAAGCDGYISKPIDVGTFVAQIEAVCAKSA